MMTEPIIDRKVELSGTEGMKPLKKSAQLISVYIKLKNIENESTAIITMNAISKISCPTSYRKRIPTTTVNMINIASESLSPVKRSFNPITAPSIS